MSSTKTTKTILLIDSEASARELVQVCLNDLAGWHVVTASSAQEGLKQLTEKPPDAILLDVLISGMDASTFISRLRASPSTALTPVILLSVRAKWFTPQRLEELGIVKSIAKPFDVIDLPIAIAKALGW